MSWHYLQGAEVASSEAISWDGKQFVPSRSKTTLGAYCLHDNETASSRASRYGMIFGRLMDGLGAGNVILFPAGSRVRTFRSQEEARGLTENVLDSGRRCAGSFAKYDRDSRSWKTSQLSLEGDLIEFSGIWPPWGTMRGGVCWELTTPEHHTTESESGYLPTPTDSMVTIQDFNQAMFAGNDPRRPKYKDARFYPTPHGLSNNQGQGGGEFDKAIRYWPTPAARDYKTGDKPESRRARNNYHRPQLNDVAAPGGQLSPLWVEWLMNWPIGWSSLKILRKEFFDDWKRKTLEGIKAGSTEIQNDEMRKLWWDKDPSETSYRPQSDEQYAREYKNSLSGMSQKGTSGGRGLGTRECSASDLSDMRGTVPAGEKTEKGKEVLQEAELSIGNGTFICRTAMGIKDRVNRLKAIGNAQVPAVAALAFVILSEGLI